MNHIYKVIWNTITQTWVAVSELSRVKGKTKSSKTLSSVVLAVVSAGAIVGGAEAAMFAGQGDGISIQSQERNEKVAKAEGVTTIAIGYDVSSKGTSALAIGMQTHATGEKTVAIGHLATATGSESAAFGVNATAAGNGDIALGKHAVAKGGADGVTGSAALGDEAHATGAQSAAVGGKSSASGTHTIASGYKAGASGENAAAFGADSTASGTNSASIGPSSTASGSNSASLGMQAQAKGAGSLAAGAAAQATKDGSTAVGTWTEATAEKTTALGDSAHATTNRATALGHDSQATGEFSTAAGVSSRASGSASVATGKNATASGDNTIAIGNAANAAGTDSIATGRQAATTGSNAIATGADSSAANNASAYGNKAKATGGWSSAFGNESKAAAADASAFGNTATAAAQDSTAIGAHSSVTSVATGGTALGRSSSVTTAGGVALGQGSASTRAALDGKNITISSQGNVVSSNHITDDDSRNNNSNDVYAPVRLINDPNTLTRVKNTIKGSAGAVSLGNGTTTRQLTNLAPGSADSDAVNVAQLKAVVGSIKKYTVTSPDGSITITNPTPGQDPQNFQISMNTTAVQNAAAWNLKEGSESGNGEPVKGGNTVTFTDTETIDVKRNGKTLTFHAKTSSIKNGENSNEGKPWTTDNNGQYLAKTKNIVDAIQNSGWTLQANGQKVGLVNPGDKVNIATDANSGITITPTNENAGVSTIKLKANVTGLTAGENITISNNNGNYTINAKDTNTQATVSKANGDNPITLDSATTNANGTTNYKVGLAIDDSTLEIKGGKLAAKAQAKAIETVESKAGGDNIAQVNVKSGNAGDAGATYQVNVSKNTVKDAAQEAVTVSDDKKTNVNSPITVTASKDEANHSTDYKVSFDGNEAAKVIPLTYKANGQNAKTVKLSEGLDFTNGKGTKASVGENGKVTFDATVADVKQGDNVTINKDETTGVYTVNAKDTITTVKGKDGSAAKVTTATGSTDTNKIYEVDVNVDGTTIVNEGGTLKAKLPDVSTTDLTVNEGKITKPSADDGKKLVNATTVANAVNNSYWKATRGTSDETNADEGDATSNVKAGDELTFVAGKNMALKKAGNTFTYGTKNDVSFTTVTSNGVTVNNGGSLTVGAGSTINMGDNVVGGVKAGVKDTDAVNVAQLKANTSVVSAGDNITVTQATNTEGNKVYTVAAKNTQATVSKANGDNPITLDSATTNANGTTNYKVGLAIDDSTLEIKGGKLAAKAQAKAIETVESKAGGDNIAQVNVKSGNAGDAGATYQVNVSKNTVKDAAQEAVTVSDDKKTNVNSPITVTASKDEANHSTDYKVSFDGNEAAKVIPLTYKANGQNAKTVKLSEGLDFTNGKGTKASVGENGKVTFDATVADVKQGDNVTINKDETTGVYTVNAKDTITTVKGKDGSAAKVTTATGSTDTNKIYEVDVNVDGTTIVNEGGTLKAKLPDVSTTDLTVNEGKITKPSADDGKKLVNATTVANAVNNSYWKATRGTSDETNADEGDATSNVKAGDELTFVAGKNMALKKAGNTFTYGTKDNVSFNKVTSTEFVVSPNGKFTVGAGSTINMGDNIIHGVKAGEANTDAVNVAQLKANTTTVVAGKNVSVDVTENASTGKTFTVNADKTTVSGTGPVTVKATSDAANHTTNYNVEFDSSKAAEQTDLTYKANGNDAKKVKLSEGLDFTNGKGTKASVGNNGKVTFDATVADVKQGDNVTINKDETTGVYTVNAKDTITTVKGKNGSAAKVTSAAESTDTNKIYEVDVNVDGKTIVNENGTLQAKGWKTKVVKGEGEVEGASEETVNGSDTVNYIAGKNVKLVQDGKNFTIATKDNVTFKDTTTTNLSVTPGGKVDMGNNKVTNVAEGTENTDAVNVKQLKDFKAEVADGGLTFAGNSGTAHKAKLNTTVNIKGGKDNTDATKFDNGKNVMTTVNGDTVTVSIKKTPEVEGINIIDTTGNVKVKLTQTDEGLKVSDGNNNATRITNVKAGEKDTDAVNVKQLKAAKTEVEAGENIEVTSRTDATNGQTIYKVSAKGINDTSAAVKGGSDRVKVTKSANTHKDGSTTVTDYTVDLSNKTKEDIKKGVDAHTEVTTKGLTFNADKGTTGVKKLGSKVSVNGDGKNITTTADENGVKVSMKDDIKVNSVTAKEVKVGGVNINENGINAGGKRITNVAPGKDGTDAVNVNQLKYVAGNISNQINNVDKGLRAGIAGALASGGLYHVTTAGKSMVSVGAGTYRGQNALAVGYSRLSDNGKVGVKFTVNSNSQGHAGASASVGYQW